MAEKRDYYEVLGVKKDATEDEIKSAFRKQAKTCHPDLHPGDKDAEARFKELNEAAEVLCDKEKRAKYDQFGHAAFDPSMGGQNPFEGGFGFDMSDLFDFFGGAFGGSGRTSHARTGPVRGNDLQYNLVLTFDEAVFGAKKEILVPREESCEKCGGTGARPGTKPERCTTCGGTGTVRTQQNTILGSFTSTRPCSACHGTGQMIKEPCQDCRGTGRIRRSKRISVTIPAGINNGQTISIRGEGEAGVRGGERGDLYVTVTVKESKTFKRNGYDLFVDMPVSFTTAALGGEIMVPGLNGSIKTMIQPGTQTGTTLRLGGQGVQMLKSGNKGDLFVNLTVQVPKRLSDEQKSLLEQFAKSMGDVPQRPKKKSFFGK